MDLVTDGIKSTSTAGGVVIFIAMLAGVVPLQVSFAEVGDNENASKAREGYTIGQVRWLEELPFGFGPIPVQVTDPDMNLDPGKQDSFEVDVYSKGNRSGTGVKVYETGNNTGVFEGQVYIFTIGNGVSGEGQRMDTAPYDILVLVYDDKTVPDYPEVPDATMTIYAFNTIFMKHNPVNIFGIDLAAADPEKIQPPKVQIDSGIIPEDIKCKKYRYLFFKTYSNQPVCLKYESIEKMYERKLITQYIPLYFVTSEEYKVNTDNHKYDYASFLEVPIRLDEIDTINRIGLRYANMVFDHYIKDGIPILIVSYIQDTDTGKLIGKTIKKINAETGTTDEYTVYR